MKKILIYFAFAAVITAALTACNKELETVTPSEDEAQVFTFAIGESGATKSVLGSDENGRFVQFDDDDNVNDSGVGCIAPNAQGYSKVTPATGNNPVTFSIYTKGVRENDKITVWYPYRSKQTNATAVELVIPEEQNHKAGNVFNMKAMPMITKQITVTAEMIAAKGTSDYTPIETINFSNLGALLNFKVFSTSSTYASEKVKSITFNAKNADGTADAMIGGTFTKNLATIDPDNESTMAITDFTAGVSSIITKPYEDAAIGTSKATALDLYMVVAPGTYKGTIMVKTDVAEYTYTINTAATLARSTAKAYGLDLNSSSVTRVVVKHNTYTITQDDVPFAGSGYKSYTDEEISGIGAFFNFEQIMKSEANFQLKASSGVIENTTAIGSKIVSIEFTTVTNSVNVTAGSSNTDLSAANVTKNGDTYTFADGCQFFRIATGDKYAVIGEITVTYYPAKAINWNLNSIAVTTQPTKTSYYVGELFDASGMVITATYVDAEDQAHTKTEVVTGYTFTPSGALALSDNSVTVSYTEGAVTKTATVNITVTVKPTLNLTLAVNGLPTEFNVGNPFSFGTGTVKAVYSDNSEKELSIDDVTIEGFNSTAEATGQQITIKYTEDGITATATITVDIVSAKVITIWEDDFSSADKGGTTAVSSWSGSLTGFTESYTVQNVYPCQGYLKFAGSKNKGSIETPALTTTATSLKVTVKLCSWGTDKTAISISCTNGTPSITSFSPEHSSNVTNSAPSTWDECEFTITNVSANFKLKFESPSNGKRFFMDDLKIETNN